MEVKFLHLDGSVTTQRVESLTSTVESIYGSFRLISISTGGGSSKTQIYVEDDEDGNIRPEIAAKVLFDALNRIN